MANLSKTQKTKLAKCQTKSGQIRYLKTIGFTRSEIKNQVGVIYQFVNNVWNQPIPKNPVDKI